jgi:hypothetical protein
MPAPHPTASKMGYYSVQNRIYASRCAASFDASVTGHQMYFWYNNHVFDLIHWDLEPHQSLQELYRLRAQQLRDRYDHLIISYSAGSDSHNLCQAFINADIKFDELYMYFADHLGIDKNTHDQNTEILLAGDEVIQWCRANNIKITYDNLCDYRDRCHADLDWIWHNDPTFMISTPLREQSMRLNLSWQDLVDRGKSVAIVLGAEKPRLYWQDHHWFTTFVDVINSYNWPDYHTDFNGIVLEAFYATPDLPDLIVKQCHVLKNHIESGYDLDFVKNNFALDQKWNRLLNEKLTRQLLYPYWKESTFSTGKSPAVFSHKDQWLWQFDCRNQINYFAGLQWINQNIDSKWFNNENFLEGGFMGIPSGTYWLTKHA